MAAYMANNAEMVEVIKSVSVFTLSCTRRSDSVGIKSENPPLTNTTQQIKNFARAYTKGSNINL